MKPILYILIIFISLGCDSLQTYHLANPPSIKTDIESKRNARIIIYDNHEIQVYVVRFNFQLSIELQIQNKSKNDLYYTTNLIKLTDSLDKEITRERTYVYLCNSEKEVRHSVLKIKPNECYSI